MVRQPSSGINSAMNLGMRMATGRYVQFLSAADTLLLDGYGHCLDMMRYEKPEIIVFDSSRDEKQRTSYEDGKMESGTEFMRHNTINPSPAGYAFRKNLTEGMTFDTANESSDEEFTVLLFLKAEKVLPTTAVARFKGKDRQTAGGDDKETVIKKHVIHLYVSQSIIHYVENNIKTVLKLQNIEMIDLRNGRSL